ncbi:MAG: endonuclease domain-containing protein, partial [Hyphomicrobiales bacterium]
AGEGDNLVEFKVTAEKRAFAKSQRGQQTAIEGLVWRELRAKRFGAMKFKRQVPIGPFVADFVCFRARLIIEVDGPMHQRPIQRGRDLRRDAWFRAQGFSVIRISGDEAIGGLDHALDRIQQAL